MKDFAKEHPWMTFFIALSILGTLRVIVMGFEMEKMAKAMAKIKGYHAGTGDAPGGG